MVLRDAISSKNRFGNDAPLRGACLLPLQHTRPHRQHPRGDQDEHGQIFINILGVENIVERAFLRIAHHRAILFDLKSVPAQCETNSLNFSFLENMISLG